MNIILLILFALPLAVIVVAIALQRLLRCPILVASIIFAIFLIVAVVLNNLNILVLAIIYSILAYLAAVLSCIFCKILRNNPELISCSNCCRSDNRENNNSECNDITLLNSNITVDDINSSNNINTVAFNNNDSSLSCSRCGCENSSNTYVANTRIIPNRNSMGRSGSFSGCYRRR